MPAASRPSLADSGEPNGRRLQVVAVAFRMGSIHLQPMPEEQANATADAQELQDEQIEGASGGRHTRPATGVAPVRTTNTLDDEARLNSGGGTPGLM